MTTGCTACWPRRRQDLVGIDLNAKIVAELGERRIRRPAGRRPGLRPGADVRRRLRRRADRAPRQRPRLPVERPAPPGPGRPAGADDAERLLHRQFRLPAGRKGPGAPPAHGLVLREHAAAGTGGERLCGHRPPLHRPRQPDTGARSWPATPSGTCCPTIWPSTRWWRWRAATAPERRRHHPPAQSQPARAGGRRALARGAWRRGPATARAGGPRDLARLRTALGDARPLRGRTGRGRRSPGQPGPRPPDWPISSPSGPSGPHGPRWACSSPRRAGAHALPARPSAPATAGPSSTPTPRRSARTRRADPLHYAGSLVRHLAATPGQEVASHTFSHYYCLEAGQDEAGAARRPGRGPGHRRPALGPARAAWCCPATSGTPATPGPSRQSRLLAATADRSRRGATTPRRPRPRAWPAGRRGWPTPTGGSRRRPPRPGTSLVDDAGLCNIPASAFLRPYTPRRRALEPRRRARLLAGLRTAARRGRLFHLWWHPHNFARHPQESFDLLRRVLDEADRLAASDGLMSLIDGRRGRRRPGGHARSPAPRLSVQRTPRRARAQISPQRRVPAQA